MREYIAYLNRHSKDIRSLYVFCRGSFDYDCVLEISDGTQIEQLSVGGEITRLQFESLKSQAESSGRIRDNLEIRYVETKDLYTESKDGALLIYKPFNMVAAAYNETAAPKYLFVENEKNVYTDPFEIWEHYKKQSDFIQIKTYNGDENGKILEWKKDETNDILLSVIFPVYNVGNYLKQCLDSITAWNADYVEYLFVDDGSPDNSAEIIAEYAKKDSRVKLLRKENGGCASARQYGLDRARGTYVGFIDPDDFIDDSMFKKLLAAAMNGNYDIAYAGYNEYYETTKETAEAEDMTGEPYKFGTTDPKYLRELLIYLRVAIWRGIYKKQMIDDAGIHFYTDLRRFDDLPFMMEVHAAAKSVIAVDEYLYYYRLARPGQDVSANDERLYVHFPIFEYLNKSIGGYKNEIINTFLLVRKVSTHRYALSKIKEELIDEYLEKAAIDITGTPSYSDFIAKYVIKRRMGKDALAWYKAIVKKNKTEVLKLKNNKQER